MMPLGVGDSIITTLCWDGKMLASDSRETMGTHLISDRSTKLYELVEDHSYYYYLGDRVLACALGGDSSDTDKILTQINNDNAFEVGFKDHNAIGIFVGVKCVYILDMGASHLIRYPRSQKLSEGSGASFAKAGMTMGLNAVEAVKLAKKLDTASGGKVQCLYL